MNKSNLINQEADLVQLENRFKVTVEFIITADDMDEAEYKIKDLIDESILIAEDLNEKELEYDVKEIETTEPI